MYRKILEKAKSTTSFYFQSFNSQKVLIKYININIEIIAKGKVKNILKNKNNFHEFCAAIKIDKENSL